MVLLNAGVYRRRALILNAFSGGALSLGGVAGYFTLEGARTSMPYVLVLAAASFIHLTCVSTSYVSCNHVAYNPAVFVECNQVAFNRIIFS